VQPSPKLEVLQDPELLQRSLVHLAPASSLLGLGRHLFGGGALDIAVVGASVAQAGGCLDQPAKRCMEYRGVDRLYNPVPPHQHRVLIKVTLEDASAADDLFSVLMGEDVEQRRSFIQRNAKDVRFLDI
jgi:hypothetical protein